MCLVTGVAGFIGSHLAERLAGEGHWVVGLDAFTPLYARRLKERNLDKLRKTENFRLVEGDLAEMDLGSLLKEGFGSGAGEPAPVQRIYHLAAQGGVRTSWGKEFEVYARNNVLATQRLLEAAKDVEVENFVYTSSSSIYGDAESIPTKEEVAPQPISPYGVTKLAAEHLCRLYWRNHGLPVVTLRYFTVFGPRQRPDMAFRRFIAAILDQGPIEVYGDGNQSRDFTYIDDAVVATAQAGFSALEGEVFNIGGGNIATVNEVIAGLEEITGLTASVTHRDAVRGDVRHTAADTAAAREALGYGPQVSLEDGLAAQVQWQKVLAKAG